MKVWQPAKNPKRWSDPHFWIHKFRNKNHLSKNMMEVILISEFMNSEMRITSTFRIFCQAIRISFRKTSNDFARQWTKKLGKQILQN